MDLLEVAARLREVPAGRTNPSLLDVAGSVLPDYRRSDASDYLATRLTDAVSAVERGEDVNLIVSLPPGAGKSSLASVSLPVWVLNRHPDWEVGIVSAEQSLAAKFSRDVRRAVTDGNAPSVRISSDAGAVMEWETDAKGSLIARGITGAISGRRLRCLIIDDPIKGLADAYSPRVREATWEAWRGVLKPRMRPGSLVVVMHTRWHEDDLAGRLLDRHGGDWTEIRIPALAEADDPLGRAPGDPLLSVQREETRDAALARWAEIRAEVGPYVWDALYQQRPSAPGGSVFLREWWRFYDSAPTDFDQVITSWDLTFGSATGDFVVGQAWGRVGPDFYLLDQVRDRLGFTEQLAAMRSLAARWPSATAHVVEQAANGAAAIETLSREIPGVVPVKPRGSKEMRAAAVAPAVESGNVFLPRRAEWLYATLGELTAFPTGAHDDTVDALSQAISRLRDRHDGTLESGTSSRSERRPRSLSAIRQGRA